MLGDFGYFPGLTRDPALITPCHPGPDPGSSDVSIVMQNEYQYYVYIMSSRPYGTLYIGVTNNLIKRVEDHKNGTNDGFTKKYSIHHLVYFEVIEDIHTALEREKQLKNWKRNWKIQLIEKENKEWKDLYPSIFD